MKHHILVKFKKEIVLNIILDDIKDIFNQALDIDGIYSIEYHTNCINRDNRYHLMIVINMDKKALAIYDDSYPHKLWKEKYSSYIESKAIFDCED